MWPFTYYTLANLLKEMFEAEHSANTMLTWVLRGVGWLVMFVGFQLSASILTTLGK